MQYNNISSCNLAVHLVKLQPAFHSLLNLLFYFAIREKRREAQLSILKFFNLIGLGIELEPTD